jgi:DNA-binding response OmpR family regulator
MKILVIEAEAELAHSISSYLQGENKNDNWYKVNSHLKVTVI